MGSVNRSSEEARRKAAESGETPLEYMLCVLRDPSTDPQRRDDMAKAAAPYVHAKLAATQVTGSLSFGFATKEQRDTAVAAAMRAHQ